MITLRAAGRDMGPTNGSRFVVQAVTDVPRTISLSGRFVQSGEVPNLPSP